MNYFRQRNSLSVENSITEPPEKSAEAIMAQLYLPPRKMIAIKGIFAKTRHLSSIESRTLSPRSSHFFRHPRRGSSFRLFPRNMQTWDDAGSAVDRRSYGTQIARSWTLRTPARVRSFRASLQQRRLAWMGSNELRSKSSHERCYFGYRRWDYEKCSRGVKEGVFDAKSCREKFLWLGRAGEGGERKGENV